MEAFIIVFIISIVCVWLWGPKKNGEEIPGAHVAEDSNASHGSEGGGSD